MIIKTFIEPPIENNNYLLIDEASKEAALVDCSSFDEKFLTELKSQNATLKYVLLTHGHFDHIGGLNDLPEGVEVLMHQLDKQWVSEVNTYLPMVGMPTMDVPKIDRYIEDGDEITLGNTKIRVIHTPGHTQGGVCFYLDGNLFSGDTIFRESIGRCDLPGGNYSQIIDSIKQKIFTLPDETIIYPGHGTSTTVAWEKEHNSYF